MPKRTDIKSIMIIGSGPIVIGQACEFDYSGVQACKALKAQGYHVVHSGQFQPGDDYDRPAIRRCHLYRTADAGHLRARSSPRKNRRPCCPRSAARPRLNLAVQLKESGLLDRSRRRTHRRHLDQHSIGGRSPAVQRHHEGDQPKGAGQQSCGQSRVEDALAFAGEIGYPVLITALVYDGRRWRRRRLRQRTTCGGSRRTASIPEPRRRSAGRQEFARLEGI